MKKLNLTEVRVIARSITQDLLTNYLNNYTKVTNSKSFKKELTAIARKNPLYDVLSKLSKTDQDILLKSINSSTSIKELLEGDISLCANPYGALSAIRGKGLLNYEDNKLEQDLAALVKKSGLNLDFIKNYRSVFGSDLSFVIDESSLLFKEVVDKIILHQIDCKDLQSLIKQVTKYFS